MKRKFPEVDEQTIDYVVMQTLKEIAPSRDRTKIARAVQERLKGLEN